MISTGAAQAGELVAAIQRLPPCIQKEATAGVKDLEEFLWFSTNLTAFGERLLHVAGLAAVAIYVDGILEAGQAFERDPLMDDYVRTILFSRGFDRGLACSVIQRAGAVDYGILGTIVTEDHSIPSFITSRPHDPGNLVRSQLDNPPDAELSNLITNLAFLEDFCFGAASEVPCSTFRGKELELRPFLLWDGELLWRYRRLMKEEEETDHILYLTNGRRFERSEPKWIDSRVQKRIIDLARLSGLKFTFEAGRPADEALPQSVMPLFADTYPKMNNLAAKIFKEASEYTRFKLWVKPLLGKEVELEDSMAQVNDVVFVTNAIIKQCMDRDPVSVMEEYLIEEPGDQYEYFRSLEPNSHVRDSFQQQIRKEVSDYENRLRAFYCHADYRHELDRQVGRYRARLVAQKIVKLFGFPITEQSAQEGLEDYRRRVRAFQHYLEDSRSDADAASLVREALLECAKLCEAVLRVLVEFYNSLRWLREDHPGSLDEAGKRCLRELRTQLSTSGLGALIGAFRRLDQNEAIGDKVKLFLGRDSIWPRSQSTDRSHAIFESLDRLNKWRIECAHREGLASTKNAASMIQQVIDFLDWLVDPLPQPGRSMRWRIYPALLFLNVMTRNSCGISSIKYSLVSQSSHQQITLYTRRQLSIDSGSFLGLPHLDRALRDLWVDPVLIPSELFQTQV